MAHETFRRGDSLLAFQRRGCRNKKEACRSSQERRGVLLRGGRIAGRKCSGDQRECAKAHRLELTETDFGFEYCTVKMHQKSYKHFYFCFRSNFQLLSS